MYINPKRLAAVVLVILLGVSIWLVPGWLKSARQGAVASPSPSATPKASVGVVPNYTSTSDTPAPSSGGQSDSAAWATTVFNKTFAGTVPPVPNLVAIRTGSHSADGYDRIAFDFKQQASPGYAIHYTDKVTRDASGQAVIMPGSAYLQLVFSPAAAHDSNGKTTVVNPPTKPVSVNYEELWSYVMNGDNEGVLSVALGLAAKSGYRVGELRGDGIWTVYVDVRIQ
jgi:hypothetical protein